MNVNQSLHFKKYGVFIEALWKFRAPQLKLDTMTAVRETANVEREMEKDSNCFMFSHISGDGERTLVRDCIWEMTDSRKKIYRGLDIYVEQGPIEKY